MCDAENCAKSVLACTRIYMLQYAQEYTCYSSHVVYWAVWFYWKYMPLMYSVQCTVYMCVPVAKVTTVALQLSDVKIYYLLRWYIFLPCCGLQFRNSVK